MSNFLCSELECMTVPTLSCSVFWSRTPSWISFLLIINFSPARQVNYEVWGFRITDGDVCSDWGECNGCFCLDGSGNNGPFIDDLYSAKTVPVERHLCPDCGKSYVQKRNQVRDRKQHHKLDDGLRFSCSQCDKKIKNKKKLKLFLMSFILIWTVFIWNPLSVRRAKGFCTQEKPWAREAFMHSKRPSQSMRSLRKSFQK